MSELSQNARAALSALREDTASQAQRDRMRARLAAVGVAVGVSAVASTAVASAVGATAAGTAGAVGASLASEAPVVLSGASTSVAAGGKLALSGVAAKLAALPMAIKAAASVGAVSLALTVPQVFTTKPAHKAPTTHAASHATHVNTRAPQRAMRPQASAAAPAVEALPSTPPVIEAAVRNEQPLARETKVERARTHEPSARSSRIASPPPAPAPASEVHEVASVLAAESALLADALRALRTGQWSAAHTLLDRHEQSFGARALLAPERERMRKELAEHERAHVTPH